MNDRHELEELIKRWRSKQQARQSYLQNKVFDSKIKKWRIRANAKDRSAAMPGLQKEEEERLCQFMLDVDNFIPERPAGVYDFEDGMCCSGSVKYNEQCVLWVQGSDGRF